MAAATTILSAGMQVGQSAMSFANAAKQKTAQQKAQKAAAEAMESARKELSTNYYKGLDINLSSFERERDSMAAVSQQFIQAGQSSERGAAATAGTVLGTLNEAEQGITNRQISSLESLEKTVAAEEGRLSGLRSDLDLAEAEGAAQAAADSETAKNQSLMQGVQGLAGAGLSIAQGAELYGGKGKREQNKADRLQRRDRRRDLRDPYTNQVAANMTNQGNIAIDQYGNETPAPGPARQTNAGRLFSSVGESAKGLFNTVAGIFGG